MPPLVPVKSSNLTAIGHQGETLFVKFNSGVTYKFEGVPVKTHQALMASSSKGQFFARHIKDKFKGGPCK